jgi:two-component system phosphate regulon sensor histidine kinase PhoR
VASEQIVLVVGVTLFAVGVAALLASRRRRPPSALEALLTDSLAPAAEAPLPDVIDLLDVGVLRTDESLRVTAANAAAARLLPVDPRSPGRSLMEVFLDHRLVEAARSALRQGSASLELGMREPEERQVAIRLVRAGDAGLWLFVDDVTELRKLQRIRAEFIDNLAHELRTPLTTVRLLTETLGAELERADAESRIRERVAKIDVETGHLVQMVNDLLDLSRIEGGMSELRRDAVDMAAVIAGAIERVRTFADRQGVRLATDLPTDDLPGVHGDEERLGQVLVNLLHNAVKFSPAGTTVTVAAAERDGQLAIEVRDHGVGIPRADLDRVFERFYKVDKARQRGVGGTGLGLAIARHIVESHGGRIWVESQEGRGSTFSFTLLLAR